MMKLPSTPLKASDLKPLLAEFWPISKQKIVRLADRWNNADGAPVYTVAGRYSTRGWTEWTQGFVYGSAYLQYEAAGDEETLAYARRETRRAMAPHVGHFGVHDHGFNNVSTYGNLLRLAHRGKINLDSGDRAEAVLALQVSGAVQARRWTPLGEGLGFIHSFNGPHSLFIDTVRSMRSLVVSHLLGYKFWHEGDRQESLLLRACQHLEATARYGIYYGEGRDSYDIAGRTAHESIFNLVSGDYRCPSTQQGYSPFTTWTRGLAWAICGYAEDLPVLTLLPAEEFEGEEEKSRVLALCLKAALATADFWLREMPSDGISYWDTGAPGLAHMGDFQNRPAEPFNDHESVDSTAAAITAQGLLRLGKFLAKSDPTAGARYTQAGLSITQTLLQSPYLSTDPEHEGLLLHSIYHRPNGWDYIPEGARIPLGESSQWGDYHLRELAVLVQTMAEGEPWPEFHEGVSTSKP